MSLARVDADKGALHFAVKLCVSFLRILTPGLSISYCIFGVISGNPITQMIHNVRRFLQKNILAAGATAMLKKCPFFPFSGHRTFGHKNHWDSPL